MTLSLRLGDPFAVVGKIKWPLDVFGFWLAAGIMPPVSRIKGESSLGVEQTLGLRLQPAVLDKNCMLAEPSGWWISCCTLKQWWKSLGVLMSIDRALVKLGWWLNWELWAVCCVAARKTGKNLLEICWVYKGEKLSTACTKYYLKLQ